MIRNVVLHLVGELPMLADIDALPTVGDATLLCTNLRTIEGRKPISIDHLDSVFVIPLQTVRFVEIPRASIVAAGLGVQTGTRLTAIGPGQPERATGTREHDDQEEAPVFSEAAASLLGPDHGADRPGEDLEPDAELLRRIREA
jgi:hypothetical protein